MTARSRKNPASGPGDSDRWAAQIAALDNPAAVRSGRKAPITVDRIVRAAFAIVEAEGYDALTMRRVAAALQTGPASLYAHVRNKAELDDLLIGELCSRVELPAPDPSRWSEQFTDVCTQVRELYLQYPGISRAAFTAVPRSLDTLRLSEGLLALLLAGGVAPQDAAWAIDAAFLYVNAYSLEVSLNRLQGEGGGEDRRVIDRAAMAERLAMLPPTRFPNTVAYVQELTAGEGHERFDFTLRLLLRGLVATGT